MLDTGFLILDKEFPQHPVSSIRTALGLVRNGQYIVIIVYLEVRTGLWHLLDFFPRFE
jgi:hypothetical protein